MKTKPAPSMSLSELEEFALYLDAQIHAMSWQNFRTIQTLEKKLEHHRDRIEELEAVVEILLTKRGGK